MKLLFFLIIPLLSFGQLDTLKNTDNNYKACFYIEENPSLFLTKNLDNNFSLRLYFNIDLSHSYSRYTDKQTSVYVDTVITNRQVTDSRTTTSSNYISMIFLYNYYSLNQFDFYLGLGPRFGINFINSSLFDEGEEYLYGILAVTGIEYQVNENIFFLVEYQIRYSYSKSELGHKKDYSGSKLIKNKYTRIEERWSSDLSKLKIGIGIKF